MKLGIIVPYRDRSEHLIRFKSTIRTYLKSKKIDFHLIIVEQALGQIFNRGKLLNIGFIKAKELGCNYVVFHDVDMLPVDVDYSYSPFPVHLSTDFIGENWKIADEYFGGVTLFPIDVFEEINGFPNDYWGWGYEDDELLHRCVAYRVDLNEKVIPMMGGNTAAVKFNGISSAVETRNVIDVSKPSTIFVNCFPDDIICNPSKYDDVYPIFSIPDINLVISYDSYKKYHFHLKDDLETYRYVNSDILPNYKTSLCVTLNPFNKTITLFQDGNYLGDVHYSPENLNLSDGSKGFIGTDTKSYFKGLITTFAIFNEILNPKAIYEVSRNQYFGLTSNFGSYKSSQSLIQYYEGKFIRNNELIDLSMSQNNAKMIDCKISEYHFEREKIVRIPHRRKGTFELLPHEPNGFVNGSWKNSPIRFNQMRFFNEDLPSKSDIKNNGIVGCKYSEVSCINFVDETHVVVEI